ncbi:MAG: nucleoside monophosphate kinase [Candidatus Wildermuthbacteria bacterium]|nr:nucleoside monophosphate kinase [Candidatus Wildermuthbacteria bacterium]
MEFPLFKTKLSKSTRKFNLTNPKDIREYFELKAGPEIEKLRKYLEKSSFVAYLLGKKNAGKGTYSKMFAEIINPKKIEHFSVGDMVRSIDGEMKSPAKRKELISFLEKNYRGTMPLRDIIEALEKRNTKILLPTELILTLVKREITKKEKKAIFIDGFPRDMDQINFSLFFRDLIDYRDDPDIFVLINVPEKVIDERIKHRRVCPTCHTSRNLKLLPTSIAGYDANKKEFYLMCDNTGCPSCRQAQKKGVKLVPKEGDEKGIGPIKERLKVDGLLIEKAAALHGVQKVFLRNSVPVKAAKDYIDDYEITPGYVFNWDSKKKKVEIKEEPWVVKDDEGVDSYSLMPPPVVVSLIKQIVQVLGL